MHVCTHTSILFSIFAIVIYHASCNLPQPVLVTLRDRYTYDYPMIEAPAAAVVVVTVATAAAATVGGGKALHSLRTAAAVVKATAAVGATTLNRYPVRTDIVVTLLAGLGMVL